MESTETPEALADTCDSSRYKRWEGTKVAMLNKLNKLKLKKIR